VLFYVYVLGKKVGPSATVETLLAFYLSVGPFHQAADISAALNISQVFCGESGKGPDLASSQFVSSNN
jgi:hypothetical protein